MAVAGTFFSVENMNVIIRGGAEVYLYDILPSAHAEDEWSNPQPGESTPWRCVKEKASA